MFNDNSHFAIWNKLHSSLKRGDVDAVARDWHEALPSLAKHYDDLRMLYYLGRFGNRDAYARACETLSYLRGNAPDIMRYRLAIFRYAVEQSTMKNETKKNWMLDDLSKVLGIKLAEWPVANPEMPEALVQLIKKSKPKKK